MTQRSQTPPWRRANPKKTSMKLDPEHKADAKARAKEAGRAYPNLVDNMQAAKDQKKQEQRGQSRTGRDARHGKNR